MATAAMLATVTVPADAAIRGGYTANGVYIRTGTSTSTTALGLGYPSQPACLYYARSGQRINNDPYWNYHRNLSTGVTGYSADAYMYGNFGTSC